MALNRLILGIATLSFSLAACAGEDGAEKVNIVAHSMDGLDARHLVSSLGYWGGRRLDDLAIAEEPRDAPWPPRCAIRSGNGPMELGRRQREARERNAHAPRTGVPAPNSM
jgi:hypothetical protein